MELRAWKIERSLDVSPKSEARYSEQTAEECCKLAQPVNARNNTRENPAP
jgi:hypothetical protein